MNDHGDFVYQPEPDAPQPRRPLGNPQTVRYTDETFWGMPVPVGATAEWYGVRIESKRPRPDWKAALTEVPEPVREACAAYLRGRWKVLADRERLAKEGGKRSGAGDEAMSVLGKRYG